MIERRRIKSWVSTGRTATWMRATTIRMDSPSAIMPTDPAGHGIVPRRALDRNTAMISSRPAPPGKIVSGHGPRISQPPNDPNGKFL
jgi:hypothetical protein